MSLRISNKAKEFRIKHVEFKIVISIKIGSYQLIIKIILTIVNVR